MHVLNPPLLLRQLRQRVRPQCELVLLPPGDAKLAAVGLGDLPHGHPGGEVPPLLHLRGEVGGTETGGEQAQFRVGGRVAAGGGGLEEEVADGAGKPGSKREGGIMFNIPLTKSDVLILFFNFGCRSVCFSFLESLLLLLLLLLHILLHPPSPDWRIRQELDPRRHRHLPLPPFRLLRPYPPRAVRHRSKGRDAGHGHGHGRVGAGGEAGGQGGVAGDVAGGGLLQF